MNSVSTEPSEQYVPERKMLEHAFVRTRWLAGATLAIAAPLANYDIRFTIALLLTIAIGNAVIWRTNRHATKLNQQRMLAAGSVAFDGVFVLAAAAAAPSGNWVPFGALVIVGGEAAVRFSPYKAALSIGLLISGLATIIGLQAAMTNLQFPLREFLVISAITAIIGAMIGSTVRTIYRGRAVPTADLEVPEIPAESIASLTNRERQVLQLIVQGYSNTRIAEALVIEQKTVKNHINNIYSKLELSSRYEAIASLLRQETHENKAGQGKSSQ